MYLEHLAARTVMFSVRGMSTSSSHHSLAPPGYGTKHASDHGKWNVIPLLLECLEQLVQVCRRVYLSSHPSVQLVLNGLYGILDLETEMAKAMC